MSKSQFGNEYFGKVKSGNGMVKKVKSMLDNHRKGLKNATLKGLARKGKASGMEPHQS